MQEGDETEREIDPNEPEEGEFEMPSTSQMASAAMWVHAKENILLNGRITHPEVEPGENDAEDFDPEEAKKALQKKDPYEPRLKPLTSDSDVKISASHFVPAWQVRMCGDSTELVNPKNTKKILSNGVVVVRSTVWPGAYSFYYNNQVYQIYLGHGHKFEANASVYFCNPPQVMSDCGEYGDQPEPNPLVEPPVEEEVKPEGEEGEDVEYGDEQ